MTPDTHIKQHIGLFRAAEGGLEDFGVKMSSYDHKRTLSSIENCHMYILCLLCNACSIIKSYCLCDQRWEEIFLTGNIYILINESLKKIIGFKDKNGSRKKSLFDTVAQDIKHPYKIEFDSLQQKFSDFADNDDLQKFIQTERNMSIHFDDDFDALKLFRFHTQRDARKAFDLFIIWFSLMHELNAIISKHIDNCIK